jgi:hypothetical protein
MQKRFLTNKKNNLNAIFYAVAFFMVALYGFVIYHYNYNKSFYELSDTQAMLIISLLGLSMLGMYDRIMSSLILFIQSPLTFYQSHFTYKGARYQIIDITAYSYVETKITVELKHQKKPLILFCDEEDMATNIAYEFHKRTTHLKQKEA